MTMKQRIAPILAALGGVAITIGLIGTFYVVPLAVDTAGAPNWRQKIFYFHVPVAETSFIAFAVLAVAGAGYLVTRKTTFDIVARVSAEVGFMYGVLTMATGMIWTRSEWGKWWEWEPRLTTYLILLLFIGGYFLLRATVEDEHRRARYAAVFGIIAFLDVPLSFFASQLIPRASVHPPLLIFKGDLPPSFLITFLIAQVAMLLFATALLLSRTQVELAKQDLETIKQAIGG